MEKCGSCQDDAAIRNDVITLSGLTPTVRPSVDFKHYHNSLNISIGSLNLHVRFAVGLSLVLPNAVL